jgi:hypothetical protein
MKQILIEKFCNFNQETFVDFNAEISKNLPFIGNLTASFDSNGIIWGYLDSDFWFVKKTEGKLFENDGVTHCVDFWKNEDQYKIITDLYELNKAENFCIMPEPVDFEKHILEIDNHPSGNPRGTEFYYTKFKIPLNGYIFPMHFVKKESQMSFMTYSDKLFKILLALKQLGHSYCSPPTQHMYKDNVLFMFDSPFNMTSENLKNHIEDIRNPNFREYTRNLCIQYQI